MRALMMVPVIIILLIGCDSTFEASIQASRSGETLLTLPSLQSGDQLALNWIHSVEKTPWEEHYIVQDDGSLLLTEAVIHSFGAGVPHDIGIMKVEDGKISIYDINQLVSELHWIHSQSADYTLTHNGIVLVEASQLPHHESIQLLLKER